MPIVPKPLLNIENVGVRNPNDNDHILLTNISFKIFSGSLTTIIGPNGAGKTTLIRAILGLMPISSGQLIKSKNLTIGYVPQKLTLNKEIPLRVVDFLNLQSASAIEPYDITNLLNLSVHTLSGGEMQKLLLNLALANQPQLLIMDEPTQGVDVQSQQIFYEKINQLKLQKNLAILMVSHDLHYVLDLTDHVICLNKHICCAGNPQAVIAQNPLNIFGKKSYQHHHDHQHP